jgi:hypothetical protein
MNIRTFRASRQHGSILGYYIIVLFVLGAIASVAGYVVQHVQLSKRRSDRKNALEYSEGAALIACQELNKAYTNSSSFFTNLLNNSAGGYTKNTALSTSSQLVYGRSVSAPFSNQTAQVQIWTTNSTSPTKARVVSYATVGSITRTSTVYMAMSFGFGAAIISDSPGSASPGVSKSVAQDGNVVVDGSSKSSTFVNGGVLANGRVNVNAYSGVATNSVSQTLYGTSSEIPDYTDEGSPDQLFDFNRFIAAAKLSGNYFSNVSSFVTAGKSSTLEGIVVVDISKSDKSAGGITASDFPSGINVRGTLLFNFSGGWAASDKLVNTATMNINAANLTGVVATNPATYTTGYPPAFTNPAKNPYNLDIKSSYPQFDNFSPDDDLPALMYNIGILDIHGPANICGVVYSPSFMEIENKGSGTTQYFNGSLITGGGVYIDNGNTGSKTVVSFDPNSIDRLATSGSKGKTVQVYYRK